MGYIPIPGYVVGSARQRRDADALNWERWLINLKFFNKDFNMMEEIQTTFNFDSPANSPQQISQQINDLKMIMLSIACKISENDRNQIIKELSSLNNPNIQQWVDNLSTIKKG
ncbi:MAG TPA: hypothetical protein DEQ42_07320 [Shigella sp.]|nr:hypothetical protein [Shigella sp.]